MLLQRIKTSPLGSMRAWKRVMYPLMALMILIVFVLSLYEIYVTDAGPDVSAYIGVPADNGPLPPAAVGALPSADYTGAYLRLKPGADPRFPSNLVQLLETTTAGVVSSAQMLHVSGAAIDAVLVNQVTIDQDASQYRVYAVGQEPQETTALRLGGGRVLRIQPKTPPWAAGSYIVDVPSGGMFDTSRVYYAFAVK